MARASYPAPGRTSRRRGSRRRLTTEGYEAPEAGCTQICGQSEAPCTIAGWLGWTVTDGDWFDSHGFELDGVQAAFLTLLRARAVGWPARATDTMLFPGYHNDGSPSTPGETGAGRLLAVMDIGPRDENLVILTVGAYFDRDRVVADRVDSQHFAFVRPPTPLRLEAAGTLHSLADRTANWFEDRLAQPMWRQEWLRDGATYARRWVMSELCPLVESGVKTRGLGPPDRVVQVRGEPADPDSSAAPMRTRDDETRDDEKEGRPRAGPELPTAAPAAFVPVASRVAWSWIVVSVSSRSGVCGDDPRGSAARRHS